MLSENRCLYACEVIPRNFLIMMSKLSILACLFLHSNEIQCESLDNSHVFSEILHCWKEDELLCQNKQDLLGFVWTLMILMIL